jgi:hypothetical protein
VHSTDFFALAETIPRQPLNTLTTQFAENKAAATDGAADEDIMLTLLLQSMRKATRGASRETIFHAAGIDIMRMWAHSINREHDLQLTIEDLHKSFSPPLLASILCAQLEIPNL